jgi:hypothetical protein
MNYTEEQLQDAQDMIQAIEEANSVTYTVTVVATFDREWEADEFIEALDVLEEENMFPNGAATRKDPSYIEA